MSLDSPDRQFSDASTQPRFKRWELTLLAGAAALFAAAFTLFFFEPSGWSPFGDPFSSGHGKSIGSVNRRSGSLRREFAGSMAFNALDADSALFAKDTVVTGPASEAVLILTGSGRLELSPNTMVRLELESFASKAQGPGVVRMQRVRVVTGQVKAIAAVDAASKLVITSKAALGSPEKTIEVHSVPTIVKSVTVEPVALVAPEQNSVLPAPTDAGPKVDFKWALTEQAKTYFLEVAKKKEFASSDLVRSQQVAGTSAQIVIPGRGRYFWRIRAVGDTGGSGVSSEVHTFKFALPSPTLETKKIEFEIPAEGATEADVKIDPPHADLRTPFWLRWLAFLEITDADAGEPEYAPILHWSTIEGSAGYVLEISEAADFSKDVKKFEVRTGSFTWQSYHPGRFYWRVSAKDADGDAGAPSDTASIDVILPAPRALTRGPQTIASLSAARLHWKGSRFSSKFECVLREERGTLVHRGFTNANSIEFTVPREASYTWEVRTVDELLRPLSAFSRPTQVSFLLPKPLAAPELISPRNHEVIELKPLLLSAGKPPLARTLASDSTAPIALSWEEVKDADHYEVELARDPDFKDLVFSDKNAKNPYETTRLPAKAENYYWRVASVQGASQSSWSNVRQVAFNQSVISERVSEPKDADRPPWFADIRVGASWSNASEQTSAGVYTRASAIEGLPALSLGLTRHAGDWDIHLSVNPTVYEAVSGTSLPVGLLGTLEFEREAVIRLDESGSASISLLGDFSYEKFSQTAVDTTVVSDAVSFVPRTTTTTWFDFGPKFKFRLLDRESFISLTGGRSLTGSTSVNYSAGTSSSSLSGYRFQVKAESLVTTSFFIHAEYEDVDLSTGDPVISMSDFQLGVGARF